MEKIAASIVASLTVGWMYLLLRRRVERRPALLLTVLFAFGTSTWAISSQALWQHGPAELLVVAALWFLTGEPTPWRAFAAGLATGLVAANRPPDLALALAFGVAALFWAGRRFSWIVLFAAGAALPMVLTLAYNLTAFAKLSGGYGQAGVMAQRPSLEALAGLLVSPTRGLFVFSPFLLFLPLFFHRSLRDRPHRRLTLILAGGFLLLLLVSAVIDFRQGFVYGPRFLADALPILFWMLAIVLPTLGSASRAAFLAAGAFAVWVQCVGAFQYSGTCNFVLVEIKSGPGVTRNAWRVRHAPFLMEGRNPRQPATVLQALRSLDQPPPAPASTLPPPPLPESPQLPPRAVPMSDFYTVPPCRIVDTRSGNPVRGTPQTWQIAGGACGVPGSAVAIAGNLTVSGEAGSGVLRLQPDPGRGWLAVKLAVDAPRSVQVILPLSPEGTVTAVAEDAGQAGTHIQLDVSGYFVPG